MSFLHVSYHGQRVGTLAEARGGIFFEYEAAFLAGGLELSPLHLPLRAGVLAREASPSMRLPGLFEDSLPDIWGRRVMAEWFRRKGIPEHAITPLMMLAYVGDHPMGALVFGPATAIEPAPANLSLGDICAAAAVAEAAGPIDLEVLAEVGSSAGGARPKALIGLPKDAAASAIVPRAGEVPESHEAWLVKFDLSHDGTAGPMEEAFARMARSAGIDIPETRLLSTSHETGPRRHFAVRRFDRIGRERVHHHTLAGLCQAGGGDLDYTTFLRVTRRLTRADPEVQRAFRRAAFNVLASNRDDHGKNHGFLYRNRQWSLAPAYDLTFVSPEQLPERGMAIVGERRLAGIGQLRRLAAAEDLGLKEADGVIEEVRSALGRWLEFAAEAGVPDSRAREVEVALRGQIN